MRNLFKHSLRRLIISIIGLFLISNLYTQTSPSFKEVSFDILLAQGNQTVFIPYITDGDAGSQTITITNVVSNNDTIVDVVSYSYDNQYHMGELVVTDFGWQASADITITIDDGVDATFTGDITINVIPYETAAENGANYEWYDKRHYLPEPNENDVPWPGSYEIIPTTNGPNETMEKDFFWQLMYGYIIPSTTGSYFFYCEGNEGGNFYMNLNDGVSQDMADLTLLGEDPGWSGIIQTSAFSLQAGKPYFFRFSGMDIVNSQPFWIKWVGPGFPVETLITSEYLKTAIDITKPSVPLGLQAQRTGDEFVYLSWSESTDNNKVMGYNLYVNGELFADSIQELNYEVSGLLASTEYTFVVEAIDNYYNKSGFSQYVNETTYATDLVLPNAPQNLVQSAISSDAVQLSWDIATDGETEIRGYNIYFNSVKINTEPVIENAFTYSNLNPETQYDFEVTAIDGGLNESAKSNLLTIITPKFGVENPPISNNYKAIVSFDIDPIDEFPGIGLQIGYGKGGTLGSNRVYYGHFEDPSYANGLDQSENQKTGSAAFSRYIVDPYDGYYSAAISGPLGADIDCYMGGNINSNTYDYIIRFACKKDPSYTGNVNITLNAMFIPNVHTETITPTDDWQLYEIPIDPAYDGVASGWYLTFSLEGASGTIYLDEIEFHVAEHYVPGSEFSSKGIELLQEFSPSGVSWGGIGANSENLSSSTGRYTGRTLSIADMVYLGNTYCNGYTFFTSGIADATDWKTSGTTFTTYVDYLAGDATTYGGALRIDEGYPDLITNAKQIITEFGCEVWGGVSHNAEIGANYSNYGIWAREMADYMKMSSFYNSDKIITTYSGRSPDYYTSLHQDLLETDNNEVDWISISGYIGGNLDLEPGVDFGESVIDYHKNAYSNYSQKMSGIKGVFTQAISLTGRPFPMYFYQGNMTTTSYYGTIAQSITFTDYYVNALRNGVAHANVFYLGAGSQWSLLKNDITYDKFPLFYTCSLVNKKCKGINLETNVLTYRTIEDADGIPIDIDPVGAYAFNNGGDYSIALFSRDIENDYQVQINLPDEITAGTQATMYIITGSSIDSQDADTSSVAIADFTDSIVVDLPKYSMVVITFTADVQTFVDVPFVNLDYIKSTSVSITAPTGLELNVDAGFLTLTAGVMPIDADVQTINWEVVENNAGAVCGPYSGGFIIQGGGTCDDNGTVTIRACAMDNNTICDQVVVTISGQVDPGGCGPETYDVTFTVDNGIDPINGAQVTFNSLTQSTNSSGQTVFSNISPSVNQPYSVSATGYVPGSGTVSVSTGNVSETVSLDTIIAGTYIVTFNVDDGTMPISGAQVTFNSLNQTTSVSGQTVFANVTPTNDLPYIVSATNYITTSGAVSVVDQNVTETISLVEIVIGTYSVTFTVQEGSTPIANVYVEFNSEIKKTDTEGKVEFNNVSSGQGLNYSASISGYQTSTGTVDVINADVNSVILIWPTDINVSEFNSIKIYPNPVKDILTVENAIEISSISIISITGQKLLEHNNINNCHIDINLNKLENGVYFLNAHLNDSRIVTEKVFKY